MGTFRTARGKAILREDTILESGFSNFAFVDQHFGSNPVLRRILSVARKLNYQSLLVEEISESECSLLHEEAEALAVRDPNFKGIRARRISFFSCAKSATPESGDFLGYAVEVSADGLPPEDVSSVYESVLKIPRLQRDNNFVHCSRSFSVMTDDGEFSVDGVLYAQQNNRTYVCAHVGLRTALSCVLPEADVSYSKINSILNIDHKTTKIGEGIGILPNQVESVLTHFQVAYEKIVHEPQAQIDLKTDFQHHIYGVIESGRPALVVFEMNDKNAPVGTAPTSAPRHVIPVFGHTFNEDTWVAEGGRFYFGSGLSYFPSETWLSTFLIHDDNFGPYYCLPRNYLKKDNFRLILGLKDSAAQYSAIEAEAIALKYFGAIEKGIRTVTNCGWALRFVAFTQNHLLVLRPQLITRDQYKKHLEEIITHDGKKLEPSGIDYLIRDMPDSVWLVEASAPELFSASRRKFGELILDAKQPIPTPLTISLLCCIRLPGYMLRIDSSGAASTQKSMFDGHSALFARTHDSSPASGKIEQSDFFKP